jgi:hypothetical protein
VVLLAFVRCLVGGAEDVDMRIGPDAEKTNCSQRSSAKPAISIDGRASLARWQPPASGVS